MNIVEINGGLANQMFKYAFGQALGRDTLYDISWFDSIRGTTVRIFGLGVFNIPYPDHFQKMKIKKNRGLRKLYYWMYSQYNFMREPIFNHFYPELLNPKPNKINFYCGIFQNEAYLERVRDKISAHFTLKNSIDADNLQLLEKIEKGNSVSLHVRRGDYLKDTKQYPIVGTEYYNNAMKIIESKVEHPHYFLFSDDIEWCKANIKTDMPMTIVDINSGENGYLDMELMKNCKHNIIANSSFSWMAAYLNQNPDKIVIAPKDWIKHKGKPIPNIGLSEKYIQI